MHVRAALVFGGILWLHMISINTPYCTQSARSWFLFIVCKTGHMLISDCVLQLEVGQHSHVVNINVVTWLIPM